MIYVFIDGIGLGLSDKSINPFSCFSSNFFSCLGGTPSFQPEGELIETNAQMGYPGLPQSATGQTALFTGYNSLDIVKRHITGLPTYSLRPYIKHASIVKKFIDADLKATVINAYSDPYLARIRERRGERLMSATSLMQQYSNLPFFTMKDYYDDKALYMDITNWFLRQQGHNLPLITPQATGRKLVQLAKNYDLIIYEYFFTDRVGHKASMAGAKRIIRHIDGLLEGIWEEMDTTKQSFVLSSDHGNLEDLSHTHHTNYFVPTIIHGLHKDAFTNNIKFLYDIPRKIMELYGIPFTNEAWYN